MDVNPNLTTETDKATGDKVIKNRDTNEPILNVKKSNAYRGANVIKASWHPDFLLTHPEVEKSLTHRNYSLGGGSDQSFHRNAQEAIYSTSNFIKHMNAGYFKGDPVKYSYGGVDPENAMIHHYHLHDDEGNKFATLESVAPDKIHRRHGAVLKLDKQYAEDNNIGEGTIAASKTKHPGDNVEAALHRARYLIDNKNKEPRFVGKSNDNSTTAVYKTKLDPSKASSAYEEALAKQHEGTNAKVTRHSPTAFTVRQEPENEYKQGKIHHVMSFPGELHHITTPLFHEKNSRARPFNDIVESTE